MIETCAAFGVAAGPARRPSRVLVRRGRHARRARSARSASASSAGSATTASPSTWTWTCATSISSTRAGCPASSRRRSRVEAGSAGRAPDTAAVARPPQRSRPRSPRRSAPGSGASPTARTRPWSGAAGGGPRAGAPVASARGPDVAAGLFELRKDDGHRLVGGHGRGSCLRSRPVRHAGAQIVDDEGGCQNCREPPATASALRTLKDFAFDVVGTEAESRELGPDRRPGRARAGPRVRQLADDRRAARRSTGLCTRWATPRSWRCCGSRATRSRTPRAAGHDRLPPGACRTGAPRRAPARITSAWTCTTCRRCLIASPRSSAAPRAS